MHARPRPATRLALKRDTLRRLTLSSADLGRAAGGWAVVGDPVMDMMTRSRVTTSIP